jgi:hypothetical protein
MDPLDILPSTIWEEVFLNLTGSELLSLWKTNHYFQERLTAKIRRHKRMSHGVELVFDEEQQKSLLTTYYLMSKINNILLPGLYRLTSDIICDTSPLDFVFLVSGKTKFITSSFKFIFAKGILFRASNCVIYDTNFIFDSLTSPKVELSCDEIPEDLEGSVFVHAVSNTIVHKCNFQLDAPLLVDPGIRVEEKEDGKFLVNSI